MRKAIGGILRGSASALVLCLMTTLAQSQQQIELTGEMISATGDFIASLSETQRNSALFAFDDEERGNWFFTPVDRKGVPYKAMNEEQRAAARRLLRTLLSADGFAKTEDVRGLESVLAEIEVNGSFDRDPELYFFSIFGRPGMEAPWALRYEGHHLAFNWTFVGAAGIASTPQFLGSNPAEVRGGARAGLQNGTRVLHREEDLARELVTSLSAEQQSEAILEAAVPRDILTGNKQLVEPLEDSGLAWGDFTAAQQEKLMELVREVAIVQAAPLARARLDNIEQAGTDGIRFLWVGGVERGDAHYYRVQGPTFLIEYDNTQNNANHVHLVWRDFEGDFGRDLIRMHYEAVAAAHGEGHNH